MAERGSSKQGVPPSLLAGLVAFLEVGLGAQGLGDTGAAYKHVLDK